MQVPEGNERAELKCQCATRFKTGIEEKKKYIYIYITFAKQVKAKFQIKYKTEQGQ